MQTTTKPYRPADNPAQVAWSGIRTVTGNRYLQVVQALALAEVMLRFRMSEAEQSESETLAYISDLVLACQGKEPVA